MVIPTVILGTLAVVLFLVAYGKGGGQHGTGVKIGMTMLVEIFPLLVFALIVAGMVQVLLPPEFLVKWVGSESGMRGILIGSVAGGLTPGGPFVSMPLAAGLAKSGAAVGPLVAYLTAWALWAVSRLPLEVGVLGWKLTFIRLASTAVLPPLAGWIAHLFFHKAI